MASSNDVLKLQIIANFGNSGPTEKEFAVRKASRNNHTVVAFTRDGEVAPTVEKVGADLKSLTEFLRTDKTVLKLTIKKTFYNHDIVAVCYLANMLLKAKVSNTALKHAVVTLDGLEIVATTEGLNSSFPENTTFTLGLRDMKEASAKDVANLEEDIRTLKPAKLGLSLHGSCPMPIFEAVLKGAADNSVLYMLTLEELDAPKAELVAQLLNKNPNLQSLGFPKGAFSEEVAKVLIDKVEAGCPLRKLVLTKVGNASTALGDVLKRFTTEKLTNLQTLDISQCTLKHDEFAKICEVALAHPTIKNFHVLHCMVRGGDIHALNTSLGNLLSDDRTLETIKMDGTSLAYTDAAVWHHVSKNKTLRKVSLRGCNQHPSAWKEVYAGLLSKEIPTIAWDLGKESMSLPFGHDGGIIECAKEDKSADFDWIVQMMKEIPGARHTVVITPKSLQDDDVVDGLAVVLAEDCVKSVSIQVPTKGDMMKLLAGKAESLEGMERVLPMVHGAISKVDFVWETNDAPALKPVEEKKTA